MAEGLAGGVIRVSVNALADPGITFERWQSLAISRDVRGRAGQAGAIVG